MILTFPGNADPEFIYFMESEMSPKARCQDLAKINIPRAKV